MVGLPEEFTGRKIETLYGDAWDYEDILKIVDYLQNAEYPYMVTGGDVLNPDLTFTLDGWMYNFDLTKDCQTNRGDSFSTGIAYMKMYVEKFGCDFYFTLSISDCYRGEAFAQARKRTGV